MAMANDDIDIVLIKFIDCSNWRT